MTLRPMSKRRQSERALRAAVVEYVILVCRLHHDLIGDHPAEAHRIGLHGFSWERPDHLQAVSG